LLISFQNEFFSIFLFFLEHPEDLQEPGGDWERGVLLPKFDHTFVVPQKELGDFWKSFRSFYFFVQPDWTLSESEPPKSTKIDRICQGPTFK
jgi:hypothetical protein